MTFTPDALRRFAKAGGWTRLDRTDTYGYHWVDPHKELHEVLPDFPNDLVACFEVLEHVCHTYTLNKVHPDNIDDFGRYELEIYRQDGPPGRGDTKQEAIIHAVLVSRRRRINGKAN